MSTAYRLFRFARRTGTPVGQSLRIAWKGLRLHYGLLWRVR